MNRQQLVYSSLLTTLFVFGIAVTVALFQFALPRGNWVEIGPAARFPPSDTPYLLRGAQAFLVNQDGDIRILSSHPPHPAFHDCTLRWDAENRRFIEPCGGASFALDGSYLNGPSPRAMDRLAFVIEGGEIRVETTRPIPGGALPTASPWTPEPAATP